MTRVADVAAAQWLHPAIDVRATAALYRDYVRAVTSVALTNAEVEGDRPRRLSPGVAWYARVGNQNASQTGPRRLKELKEHWAASSTPKAELRIVTAANATTWDSESVVLLKHALASDISNPRIEVAAEGSEKTEANLTEALEIMRDVWPEAAVELEMIIESIIVLRDTELSVSHDHLFGTIFAGELQLRTVEEAYQLLLHECGHHSMYIRQWRCKFLLNPDDLVAHPLRADPRPMSGALHAAFVLWRMTEGFARWSRAAPAAPAPALLRDSNREKLKKTLETLKNNARWSEGGELLFENLRFDRL